MLIVLNFLPDFRSSNNWIWGPSHFLQFENHWLHLLPMSYNTAWEENEVLTVESWYGTNLNTGDIWRVYYIDLDYKLSVARWALPRQLLVAWPIKVVVMCAVLLCYYSRIVHWTYWILDFKLLLLLLSWVSGKMFWQALLLTLCTPNVWKEKREEFATEH